MAVTVRRPDGAAQRQRTTGERSWDFSTAFDGHRWLEYVPLLQDDVHKYIHNVYMDVYEFIYVRVFVCTYICEYNKKVSCCEYK